METKEITQANLFNKSTGEKFLPSQHGFGFGNTFKSQSYSLFFNHAAGMCGGMVFAVRDYHESGSIPPSLTEVPTIETQPVLLDYIAQRQSNSVLQVSAGNYFLMPKFNQSDCEQCYLRIKQDILENHLSILGLVRTKSLAEITRNHQIGVYAFTEDENGEVTLSIYDPVRPRNDNVFISFNYKSFTGFTCNPENLGPIYSIFHPTYHHKTPPSIMVDSSYSDVNFLSNSFK